MHFPKYFKGEHEGRRRLYFATRWLFYCHKKRRYQHMSENRVLNIEKKKNRSAISAKQVKSPTAKGKVRVANDVSFIYGALY